MLGKLTLLISSVFSSSMMHVLASCEYVLLYFLFFFDAVSAAAFTESLDEPITSLDDDFSCRPDNLNSQISDETLAITNFPVHTDTKFTDDIGLFRRQETDQEPVWRPTLFPKPKKFNCPPGKRPACCLVIDFGTGRGACVWCKFPAGESKK